MNDLKIVKETPEEIIYLSYFEGQPVRFMRNKRTGEITINADDVVRALGEADSRRFLEVTKDWILSQIGRRSTRIRHSLVEQLKRKSLIKKLKIELI